MNVFENISVVLVETHEPGNLGSVARAMANMGLSRLKLVNPCNRTARQCRMMAVSAFDLIENASVFPSLVEAIADEQVVVGTTSSRGRSQKVRLYPPREVAPIVWEFAESQKVALVFGPERRGLSEDDLALCQYLVTIPASEDLPTLNLAQAVLILAYEIWTFKPVNLQFRLPLAEESVKEQMFQHMEEVLIQIGFLSQDNPGHIMRSIRRLLSRAELTDRDVKIMRGIMSQMEWFAREGKKLTPEQVQKP